jgi:ribosomal protein S18 acetylase RimI-like enzyme
VGRISPFYLGLYGDGDLPGVLDSDAVRRDLYESSGYQAIERRLVFGRDLRDYRPPVDRGQVQYRRQMIVDVTHDPLPATWWEACTVGDFEVSRYDLIPRGSRSPLASLTVRDSQPAGFFQSGRGVDLMEIHVNQEYRRRGLATYLLQEAFRQLTRQGVSHVTGQVAEANEVGIGLYKKLGLQQVNQATVFQKRLDPL